MNNLELLKQLIYYHFILIRVNHFSLSINAFIIVGLLIGALFLKKKKSLVIKILFLTIIINFLDVFVFIKGQNPLIDFNVMNRLNYFIYLTINYPKQAFFTFFYLYSLIIIIIGLFMGTIYEIKEFILIIVVMICSKLLAHALGFRGISINAYHYILLIIFYSLSYLINKKLKRE
ncbi:MAG: hypothetical protein ACRCTA_05380 [Bacilli bacterium]